MERDTLGLDAAAPQRLHAEVLDAAERALARSLSCAGATAEAPKPPGSTQPLSPPSQQQPEAGSPAALFQLSLARAAVLDTAAAAEQGSAEAEELSVVLAAEAAWLPGSR